MTAFGDWAKPLREFPAPPVGTPAPSPPRAMVGPPPAEVICSLDLMDYEMRGFGVRYSLTGKKRRKAQLQTAADLLDRGEPFIFDGRRIPGRNG